MTPADWLRIQPIAEGLLDLPPEQRAAAAQAACGGDTRLLAMVMGILKRYSETADLAGLTPATLPVPSLTGERVGNYLLGPRIGEGGMGSVYLAERADQAFSKTVAVKVSYSHGSGDLFLRERQILARFEHAHIARLLDAGSTAEGALFLVMEYVEGAQPVTDFARDRNLPVDERLRLFLQACSAVQHAHNHTVVHCDLKPANVLVNSAGQVKVVDFGIASLADHTASGFASPGFASPEQLTGAATMLSDVYALGVLLRHLIADQPELAAVVRRATRTEPSERYESVAALAADIRAYREIRPVPAYGSGVAYYARKWVRRHPIQAAALALAACSAAAATGIALWQQARAAERTVVVREMTRKVLLRDLPALREQPNATRLQARLMSETASALALLEGEAAAEPELAGELADAYCNMGRIKGSAMGGSLANHTAAQEDFERARRLYQIALTRKPDDLALRGRAFRASTDLAYQLLATARFAEAKQVGLSVEKEILGLPLPARATGGMRYQLSRAYHVLGNASVYLGTLEDGSEYRRKALAVYAPASTAAPPPGWPGEDLRDHVANLHAASASTGRVSVGFAPRFEQEAQRALQLLESCGEANCRVRVLETAVVLAEILFSAGRAVEAVEALGRNLRQLALTRRNDPGNLVLATIELETRTALARIHLRLSRPTEALDTLGPASASIASLRQADAKNDGPVRWTAIVSLLEAQALRAAGRTSPGEQKLQAAQAALDQAERRTPELAELAWAILDTRAGWAPSPAKAMGWRIQALAAAREVVRVAGERAPAVWAMNAERHARAALAFPTPSLAAEAAELLLSCRETLRSDYPVVRGGIWAIPPTAPEVTSLRERLLRLTR